MNKDYPDISIILPGIRKEKWAELYQTIQPSCGNYTFELILVGPHKPEEELLKKENLIWIQDFGNPVRCQQIAAQNSVGKYITWISDDGILTEKSLEKALDYLEWINNYKQVCIFNYTENGNLVPKEQFKCVNAYPKAKFININYWIFNCAIMNTGYFKEIGGYDCQFETTAISHNDLAIRCQNDGAEIRFFEKPLIKCSWMPDISGDHAPVHYATFTDQEKYIKIYNDPENEERINIEFNNWEQTAPLWERRFNNDRSRKY